MDTLNKLQDIFRDIFDDENLVLKRETSTDDIEDWDSLTQVNIIVACEAEFNIKFGFHEIVELKSVGDIMDIVNRKLSQ